LETAGLEFTRPIIQIAAIAVSSQLRELESCEIKLLFDENQADPAALRSNHYDPTVWKAKAVEPEAGARIFAAFLRRHATVDLVSRRSGAIYHVAKLVAHNGEQFDGPFLRAWYKRLGLFLPAAYSVFCTKQRAYCLFHEDKSLTPPDDFELATLCHHFGVSLPPDQAHDTLNDVRATVSLYRRMMEYSSKARNAA
jgi:hypothetical protein